jgi:very-short-patch-repair endonuclease
VQETPIERQFREAADGRIDGLEPQQWIGGYRVDFLVRSKRLVIELDGHDYHKTKEQRTNDASRQRKLQSLGYSVIRFTGTEIFKDAALCVEQTLVILSKRPDFMLDSESIHPECYFCVRLQEAVTILIQQHGATLHHPYCYFRFELPGPWDPLSIEKNDQVVSVNHFTIENGDVVYDPVVDFAIIGDADLSQWVPLNMQNRFIFLDAASYDEGRGVTVTDLDLQAEIAAFCEIWGANIRNQGWFEKARLVRHDSADEV